jgi:hypothetical protein
VKTIWPGASATTSKTPMGWMRWMDDWEIVRFPLSLMPTTTRRRRVRRSSFSTRWVGRDGRGMVDQWRSEMLDEWYEAFRRDWRD